MTTQPDTYSDNLVQLSQRPKLVALILHNIMLYYNKVLILSTTVGLSNVNIWEKAESLLVSIRQVAAAICDCMF